MRHASHFFKKNIFQQILLVMISTLLLFPGCSQFQNGEVDPIEYKFERSYYEDGQLEYEASYLHGKLDGTSKVWYPDGNLKSASDYKLGQPHGKWEKFFKDGGKMYEVFYAHGLKEGYEKWYHENGAIKSEQEFKADMPVTDITRWKNDGTLLY